MQLERLLRSQGFGSRPECRALIYSGKVFINGVCCDDPFADFQPEGFKFTVDGVEWIYRSNVYIMLNKPADFECSHKPKFHPSIYTLLPKAFLNRGVQAVGRLDEDTTGLLLFSDDGQFIHKFTSPKKKIEKFYDVTTKHGVTEQQVSALLSGVKLNDEPEEIQGHSCTKLGDHSLRLGVTEGKYHLVKRMVAAAGNRVEGLNRVAIGGLVLPDNLKLGEWQWLESEDLELLAKEI
jgi:16S rRNA pseudouridine516 synthase